MKIRSVLAVFYLLFLFRTNAQCIIPPVFPSCTGTEILITNGDQVSQGEDKFFYGAPSSISNLKMRGGTLVVCDDLTLNELVFDSGTIFIKPNVTLIISNAAGLILKGNARIYNAGTFQCLGNIVMDGTYATAARPNIFMNVLSASRLLMSHQYYVINNPFSWLVNNGQADFHGLITDPLAAKGSVCMGLNSQIRMRVLYNRAKHPYISPAGQSCVYVSQFSQFYDSLTNYPSISVCLENTHSSDASCIPWGCRPNAWGAAQVSTGCSNCASLLTFLELHFKKIEARMNLGQTELLWETTAVSIGKFFVQRSEDGSAFFTIDTVPSGGKTSFKIKSHLLKSNSFYRIIFQGQGALIKSEVVYLKSATLNKAHPNPFKQSLQIPVAWPDESKPVITVMDGTGRSVRNFETYLSAGYVNFNFGNLPAGLYMIEVKSGKERKVYKVIRE